MLYQCPLLVDRLLLKSMLHRAIVRSFVLLVLQGSRFGSIDFANSYYGKLIISSEDSESYLWIEAFILFDMSEIFDACYI